MSHERVPGNLFGEELSLLELFANHLVFLRVSPNQHHSVSPAAVAIKCLTKPLGLNLFRFNEINLQLESPVGASTANHRFGRYAHLSRTTTNGHDDDEGDADGISENSEKDRVIATLKPF